jgi:uncharacterized Ntn-hydrolase superfamily protein
MKALVAYACMSFTFSTTLLAQDTFSIVAADTLTGEIGSAGASCVGAINGVGAFILSDVLEGIGAIHTQASYLEANQQTARQRMLTGDSPQQIIDWMVTHDAQGNPTVRQYGIVDLRRRGESAAYTGVNCTNYKNHATGPGYAVQGNILSGQIILDTMKNTFLRAPGPLVDRLMATLEAAKIVGADTRCATRGTSSRSSFIKVVRIGDGAVPYLQKVVPDSPVGSDPITSLHALFNQWKDSLRLRVDPFLSQITTSAETLFVDRISSAQIRVLPKNNSDSLLTGGRRVLLYNTGLGTLGQPNANYVAVLTPPPTPGTDTITARVVSGVDTVKVFWKIVIHYVRTTSVCGGTLSLPSELMLFQNYPNPFNPSTVIQYGTPRDGRVTLVLFDILGRAVKTLVNKDEQAGFHNVSLSAEDISGGVYFCRLESGNAIRMRKLMVLR